MRRLPITIESLEGRRMFSASTPTAQEQYVVELINRARANPAQEAARYGTALDEGLSPGAITADAKQPLTVNADLMDSARGHTQWMFDTQTFSHTGINGRSPDQRMEAAGYSLAPPFEWAENIAWQSQADADAVTSATLDAIHQNLYVDSTEPDRGHRLNMLDPNLKEIGVGASVGNFLNYDAVMTTEDYAFSGSQSYLTGVAFNDSILPDNFYTPGEGLGGVQITATRASDGKVFATTTWDAGGYTLALPAGTYTVQASSAALNGTIARSNVVIAGSNVEEDFNPLPPSTAGTVTPPATGSGTAATSGGTPTTPTQTPSNPTTPAAKPTAALNRHKYGYTSANGHYFCFQVTYTGSAAIVPSSLSALNVAGPNGFTGQALLDSTQSLDDGDTLVALYYVRRPRGTWGTRDLGLYSVKMPANGAADTSNLFADAAALGSLRLVLSA